MRKFTSLLLLGFALGSFAQTPGGVSGSELWFKTAPLNSDLQGYYRWQDFSGDSIRLMLLDSRGVKSELTLPNSSVHYLVRQWENIDRHIIVRFLINTVIQYNEFNSQSFFNYNIKEIIDESIIKTRL